MGKVNDTFQEFKSWYQSKTIIGLIISSISGVVFALTNGQVDVAGAAGEVLNADAPGGLIEGIDNVWAAVTFVLGQALAFWGRFKAKLGIK